MGTCTCRAYAHLSQVSISLDAIIDRLNERRRGLLLLGRACGRSQTLGGGAEGASISGGRARCWRARCWRDRSESVGSGDRARRPLLPLDCLASTYRSDFRIQIQVEWSEAPMSRPSQLVPYESTAKFLQLRNRSISASIDLNRVFQLNTFRVRPPSLFKRGQRLLLKQTLRRYAAKVSDGSTVSIFLRTFDVGISPDSRSSDGRCERSRRAMCGRLRVGKDFFYACRIGRSSHVFGL